MSDIALQDKATPATGLERLSSDSRLARMVYRGSEKAFAALYARHHQSLYRYGRSIVGNDADAQDVLQSSMTRALTALRSQERELAVRPWLFRIVHNEAISVLRKRRLTEVEPKHLEPIDQHSADRSLEERERLTTLVADLKTLAERQRSALVMRELSGLSMEEIAAALSISPGAAKQALFEARNALQELAEGRLMSCEEVRRAISDEDGRVRRGRKLRAHLRDCARCREFESQIRQRSAQLQALTPPLPPAISGILLANLLGQGAHGSSHFALGAAVNSGAKVTGHAAASLIGKTLIGAALLTGTAVGTAHLLKSAHHRHSPHVLGGQSQTTSTASPQPAGPQAPPPSPFPRHPITQAISIGANLTETNTQTATTPLTGLEKLEQPRGAARHSAQRQRQAVGKNVGRLVAAKRPDNHPTSRRAVHPPRRHSPSVTYTPTDNNPVALQPQHRPHRIQSKPRQPSSETPATSSPIEDTTTTSIGPIHPTSVGRTPSSP